MQKKQLTALVGAFALIGTVPAAAVAQGTADTVDTSVGEPRQDDDDGFPWGLLGLLGLAGLIPRKRHVHVDNRTNH